jgi:hypothetical protein
VHEHRVESTCALYLYDTVFNIMTTGASSRVRDPQTFDEWYASASIVDPAESLCTNTNDHKAPMKREAKRKRHSFNDDDNRNENGSSSNTNSSNQLSTAAVDAANVDPLFLLQHVQQNPNLYRRVIMEMTMEVFDLKMTTESSNSNSNDDCSNSGSIDCGSSSNDNSSSSSGSSKPYGKMGKGFSWKEFKPLEQVLRHNAAGYYRLGLSPFLKLKVAFNNQLEEEIRQTADQHNISMTDYFDENIYLRDRIRGFYKNLTQYARKRFAIMVKCNSEKDREKLSAMLLLIASKEADVEDEEEDDDRKETSRTSPTASWDPYQLAESTPAATVVSPETADLYYFDLVADPILDNTTRRKKRRTGVDHVLDTSRAVLLPSHCATAAALNKIPLLLDAGLQALENDLPNSSDTIMARHQVAVEPSSKRVASAENAREDSVHVQTDRLELLNARQDSTELETGANSLLTTYRAPDNARIPTCETVECTIWNRLDAMGRDTGESCPLAKGFPLIHLRTVHELIRTRLAAGMFRTTLKLCHASIINTYNEAEGAARISPIESLKRIRTELAGAWCLYAHILWEVGALGKGFTFHGATDQRKVAASTLHQPHLVWEKHAIAVLKAATACPLVGNHSWITLAIARLTILQSLGDNNSSEMSTRKTTDSIRVAIALCWDTIVPMDGPSREETSLLALTSHELCFSPLTKEKVTVGVLKESFEAVSALPTRFLGISYTSFILDDNDSILAVCTEVNRLSRLQEKLGQLSNVALSLVDYGCNELDWGQLSNVALSLVDYGCNELNFFALLRARDVAPGAIPPRGGVAKEALAAPHAKPSVASSRSPGAAGSASTNGCQNISDTAEECDQYF